MADKPKPVDLPEFALAMHVAVTQSGDLLPCLDITRPRDGVEVRIRDDGSVLWVNVGPQCVLRICQMNEPPEIT